MKQHEFEQSWERTRAHLAAAVAHLPENPAPNPEGGRLEEYRDYLEHNELELALDELEALGEANPVSAAYWQALARAAAEMQLREHERRYVNFSSASF